MTTSHDNTTALVTGATAGIGQAVAVQLGKRGIAVIVHGRDPERGAKTVSDIHNAGGTARFIAADLTQHDEGRRLAEPVNINLRAPHILVQKLVPGMAERGHGVVVNVSTLGATTPGQGAGIYGATKAGLELLTKVWADEFGAAGVRVNAASAGPTMTPGTAAAADFMQALGRTTTLDRVAEADESANAVTFLASPAASYVNGAILQVSGGVKAISPDVTP